MQSSSCSRRARPMPHHPLRFSSVSGKSGLTENPERRSSLLYRCASQCYCLGLSPGGYRAGALTQVEVRAFWEVRTWLSRDNQGPALEEAVYRFHAQWDLAALSLVFCLFFFPRWCPLQPDCCWRCSQGSFLGQLTAFAYRSQTQTSKTTWWNSSRSSITSGSPSNGYRVRSCNLGLWPRPLQWQALVLTKGPGPCTQSSCNNRAANTGWPRLSGWLCGLMRQCGSPRRPG